MGLSTSKLEKVVKLDDGAIRARCPACAEGGQDQTGNHLRIYADGRFGCCVHPNDREHRRRIFALAGERSREGIKVRVAVKVPAPIRPNILGRVATAFAEADQMRAGETALHADCAVRTPRTGVFNSNGDAQEPQQTDVVSCGESRTLRTPLSYSYAEGEKEYKGEIDSTYRLKECAKGVRGVREQNEECNSEIGMTADNHAEHGGPSEEDLERMMNETPY